MLNQSKLVLLVLLWVPAGWLTAQEGLSPIERVPGLGSTGLGSDVNLSEEDPFAPPSEGDSDLGEQFILRREPERTAVRLRYLSDAWWGNNLAATNDSAPTSLGEEEGWFWANYLELSWRPRLGKSLFLDTFAEESVYLYEGGSLDFDSTRIGLGVIKIFPELDDLAVFARYEYLYTHANNPAYDILFGASKHLSDHFHRLRIGAHKNLFIRATDSAYAAADALINLDTDPSSLARDEFSFQLGYNWKIAYRLSLSAFGRIAYLDYDEGGREDWNHIVGVDLSYLLSDWARLHTTLVYTLNDSDTPGGRDDYDAFQAGLGVGLTTKF